MRNEFCPYLIKQSGRDGKLHLICNLDVFDGEFGSHESTCAANGEREKCRFGLLDW